MKWTCEEISSATGTKAEDDWTHHHAATTKVLQGSESLGCYSRIFRVGTKGDDDNEVLGDRKDGRRDRERVGSACAGTSQPFRLGGTQKEALLLT